MASKKFTELVQATQAETTDSSILALVIDPSGSPASRKTSLARSGALPGSWLEALVSQTPTFGAVVAGSFSVGCSFAARRSAQSCIGVRFYWNSAVVRTVRCTLWQGGVAVKTADVAVNGVGYYEGSFSASAVNGYDTSYVTVWETSGTEYQREQDALLVPPRPLWTRDIVLIHASMYGVANVQPSVAYSATTAYPVMPLMSG